MFKIWRLLYGPSFTITMQNLKFCLDPAKWILWGIKYVSLLNTEGVSRRFISPESIEINIIDVISARTAVPLSHTVSHGMYHITSSFLFNHFDGGLSHFEFDSGQKVTYVNDSILMILGDRRQNVTVIICSSAYHEPTQSSTKERVLF